MRRTSIALVATVVALLHGPASTWAADSCGVVPTVTPLRNEDKAKKEVTFAGQVQNRGTATARLVSVRLAIVDRSSGKVLGDGSATLSPSTLAPGETAKFKVSASNEGSEYLDVKVDENLTFEASRCDAAGGGANGTGSSASCDVVVNQPFEKSIDDQAHTITFTGTVENRGSGTAKNVQVTGWVISQDKLLEKRAAPAEPRNIGPGGHGTFSVTVPLEPGQRKSINDRVTVDVERCD